MKIFIADLMLLSLSSGPVFAASSPFHGGAWPIYNAFNHQPTQQDLPEAVLRNGDVTPCERDFAWGAR